MVSPKVVLVTGASSGIGRAVAEHLAREGHRVFGTSRDPSQAPAPTGVTMLPLDACRDESVRECAREVVERAGRIDVLVNNAGYTLAGAIEEASSDEVRALFETNVFGALAMTRAVLPTMRRQAAGHIVAISSGLAHARPPFVGYYAASKCALEGYSEALWHELRPLGVRVSVVAPGYVRSNIEAAARRGSEPVDAYEPHRSRALTVVHKRLSGGADPIGVARAVAALIATSDPSFYVAVGADARAVAILRRFLPGKAYRGLMRRLFRLDRGPRRGK